MKRLFSAVLIMALLVGILPPATFVTTAAATEATSNVWISSSGSDSNDGSEASPFATLAYALNQVAEGGTVHVVGEIILPETNYWLTEERSAKTVTVTGGTLDFTPISGVGIHLRDHVTFCDITLEFDDNDQLGACGNKVVMGENVTIAGEIYLLGGAYNEAVDSTDLTVLSGTYKGIYGGGYRTAITDCAVLGDVNLTVGGDVNADIDVTDHTIDVHDIYGGAWAGYIGGDVNLTFTNNAKAIYVFGGGRTVNASVNGTINTTVSGGQAMGLHGGVRKGAVTGNVNLTVNGGIFEQVFGGSHTGAHAGNVNVNLLGGTITRRVYGGCYNDYTGVWASNYYVDGQITLTIGSGVNISFSSTNADRAIYARSRHSTVSENEASVLIFADTAAYDTYSSKLCAQDTTMKAIMGSITAADTIVCAPVVEFVGQQLSLGDDLDMNYHIFIDYATAQTAVMNITVGNGEAKSYPISAMAANEECNYVFTVALAAAQMTDNIVLSLVDGEIEVASKTYTIRGYAEEILNGNYDADTKAMVKAMLNYGAAAQNYFDYNTDNLANTGYEMEAVAPSKNLTIGVDGSVSGIRFYGASLVYTSKVAVRFYFASSTEGITFKVGETVYDAQLKSDGLYYVEIAGINPQDYADVITMVVSNGTDTLTVGYSPMHYITRMYSKESSSTELKALVRAMYGYYEAAKVYKNQGMLSGKVELSVSGVSCSDVLITLNSTGDSASYQTNATLDGTYELEVPAGEYELVVTSAGYITRRETVTVTEGANTHNIVLNSKNTLNNTAFELTEEGYFKSTKAYGHNSFTNGYGTAWEATLEMPTLNSGERVGFVVVKRANNGYAWGNWWRLMVEKTEDGKLQLVSHIGADATAEAAAINVVSTALTDINADDVADKMLQIVYKDGILSLRLDGQILVLYVNDSQLKGESATTQVKNVLDLTSELYCGLLTNTAGLVIKDWAFTNIKKNVTDNPAFNAVLSGTVELSVSGVSYSDVLIALNSTQDKTTYRTYASADGTYELAVPAGEYELVVTSAAYITRKQTITVTEGTNTYDIALASKNAVHNTTFAATEDCAYERTADGLAHTIFVQGYGNEWVANMVLPDLTAGQQAGFVLHKATNGAATWGNWMRILLSKTSDGELQLYTQMAVDGAFNVSKTVTLADASVAGKTFQVILRDGHIYVILDSKIIADYVGGTKLNDSDATVGQVFDIDSGEVFCGLLANKAGIVITDWSFTNVLDAEQYTVSGTVSSGLKATDLSQTTLTFVHKEDANNIYTATADAAGNYSVALPAGDYTVTVAHPNYVDNILACSVLDSDVTMNVAMRKNLVENGNFTATEEGFYQSTKNDTHNVMKDASGTVWQAEVKLPAMTDAQGAGVILIKANANGGISWGEWMQLYIRKTSSGYELFANILNNTYKTDKLSVTAVEGKIFKVTVWNSKVIASLDDEIIGIYDKDTVMDTAGGAYTVDGVLGLTGTTGLYCGLFAKKSGCVITDWNFTNGLDTEQLYTVSGTVSAGLKAADLSQTTLTFVNKADDTKTYTVTADATGNYSMNLPTGDYAVTVVHPDYVDNILDCTVLFGNVTKDIRLRKNLVANGNFTVTEDGFYQSTKKDTHNVMKNASGTVWQAEVKLPAMTNDQGAGVILIKANASGGISWGEWMQLYIRKTSSGYELFANILNNTYKVDKLSATAVEGKIFKVTVWNSKVIASLDEEIIGIYDKDTVMDTVGGLYTVDGVLGLTGTTGLYCGLFAKTSDFVITDWNFTDVLDTDKVYTVSGTVSAGLKAADLSQTTLTFVNEADDTKTYTATVDASGKYSVELPMGDYTLTAAHPDYVDNILDCIVLFDNADKDIRLRKNIVENGNFTATEDGFYQSTKNDTHNFMKNASGTAWEAEVKLPAMTDGQGAGFILLKANANGSISWGEWMQLYIRKTSSGYELFANILNNTYKVDKLSATAVEGKIFKVTVLNGKVIALLDDEFIGIYDKDTVMDTADGAYTVDGVLGLTGTTGLYCGLFAKTSDFVITDWNFRDVFQTEVACETSLNYQGGAIYNNNAFVFNNNGTFRVMDLANGTISGVYTLDKADVLTPHANCVCFSDTFYPGDSEEAGNYPLLYVNIYNNYRGQEDEHEGTCLVYRVQEAADGTISTTLVQVIVVELAKSDEANVWKSQLDIDQAGTTAVRPYGNFVVDTDNDLLYAYTLRATEQCTRFFRFRLPEVTALTEESASDETYNATYGCYVVTLTESDIVNFANDAQYFDMAGYPVIQDATYFQGRLILTDGSSAGTDSCIRVINPETGVQEYVLDVDSLFPDLTKEAELISINPEDGSLYYMTTPGTLRKLKLPLVWQAGTKVAWEDGTLSGAAGVQSSARDRECTAAGLWFSLDEYYQITFGPITPSLSTSSNQYIQYFIFAFDANKNYLGRTTSDWVTLQSGESHTLSTDTIKTAYSDAAYFRIVVYDRSLNQGTEGHELYDIGNEAAKVKLWHYVTVNAD